MQVKVIYPAFANKQEEVFTYHTKYDHLIDLDVLEEVWRDWNRVDGSDREMPDKHSTRSMMVGDLICFKDKIFKVESVGFCEVDKH
jgi:hypothetical protein